MECFIFVVLLIETKKRKFGLMASREINFLIDNKETFFSVVNKEFITLD